MKAIRTFIALAVAVGAAALSEQAGATVVWSFFETGITCANPATCSTPPPTVPRQPYVFMTLTLPGPTSSGTADWEGFLTPPVFTGDFFVLTTPAIGALIVSPDFDPEEAGG